MILNSPYISGSSTITGNLNVLGTITGSTNSAISASYALNATSASYALVATSASYAANATTSSFALNATSASYSNNSTSASYALIATSASYATNSDLLDGRDSLTFANTGSNAFVGTQNINGAVAITGSLTTTGTITAQTLNVQQVTSSIVYSSGSNIFGNSVSNTQSMTGSVGISGSLSVNGISTLTGALSGTSATFSGLITSTVTADRVLEAISATTSGLNLKFGNTGGNAFFGLENSTGGDFAAGAYNLYILHSGNRSIVLGTNGSIRYTVNGSGDHDFKTGTATFGGALSGTSATFSGNVSLGSTSVANGTATILSTDATETRITLGAASNASYAQIAGIYNGGTPVIPVRILGSQVARFSTASFDVTGAATFSGALRGNSHIIVSDGGGTSVVLQGYIANTLRIAASGSTNTGGARGDLIVGALDVGGALTGTSATFSADVIGKRFYQFETSGTVAGSSGTATIAAYNNANFVANTWYEVKVTKTRNNTTGFGVTASLYCYWTGNLTAGTEVLKAIGGDAIISMSSNNITITNADATTNNWGATFTKINTN